MGRLRFPIEIVKTIKQAAGEDFPVSLRYSIKSYIKDWGQGGLPGETFTEMGRDTEEGLEVAKILEEAGYDAFNADAGSYDAWYWAHPPNYQKHGCYLHLTDKLKEAIHVPVMVAGRMDDPKVAINALMENKADAVVIGRGLLADPFWPTKVQAGEFDKIRPCLACHDGCFERITTAKPLSCAVNPALGREKDYEILPAPKAKKIMVVGGGIAGLEAARISALRGHQVTLFEKTDALGGHLIAGSVPDFKKGEGRLVRWYEDALQELNVDIRMNTAVTDQMVRDMNPQALFVATGSSAAIPAIPGVDQNHVMTAEDILLGKKNPGESVVVVGAGLVGCETALWLVRQGKQVAIVEALDSPMSLGPKICHANQKMLLDLLRFNSVKIHTGTALTGVTDRGVSVKAGEEEREMPADTVVLSVGYRSEKELYRSLAPSTPNLHLVGDAKEVKNIMYAIWDASEVARSV